MNRILPTLLTFLTGKRREKVTLGIDFQWSHNSWTHNAFRLFELIFWRQSGIRFEGGSYLHNGKTYRTFGTWENLIAYSEHLVRAFKPIPGFEIVRIPSFALPGGTSISSPFRFAIAFDNAQATTSTTTLSCTITGSNVYLFASNMFSSNTSATTATYNSVAMTSSATVIWVGSSNPQNGMYLAGPATGTNSMALTNSGGGAVANSYSGCAQVTPDTYGTTTSAGTTITLTLNTATASCWMVMFTSGQNNIPTAGTNATGRSVNGAGASTPSSWDSNGTIATGSFSMTVNGFSAQSIGAVGYKFAAVAGTTYTPTYTEAVTVTATLLKSTTRPLTEAITLTDSFIKSTSRALLEAITNSDTDTNLKIRPANLTDAITLTDTLLKSTARVLTQSITVSDVLTTTKTYVRTFTEAVINSDVIATVAIHGAVLLEAITNTVLFSFKKNGTNVSWTHITKSAGATWTKAAKSASATWSHITKSNQ